MPQYARVALIIIVCLGLAAGGVALIDYIQRPAEKKIDYTPAPERPSPPLIPGTNLTEVAIDLDVSDATKPVDPIVFFEAPDPYDDAEYPKVTGLLRRELYRQGALLAARHELGLSPRDALLGEEAPEDIRPFNRIRVNPLFRDYFKAQLKIEFGPPAASRLVWHAAGPKDAQPEESFAQAVTAAEALSRGRYVDALKRTGLRGQAVRAAPAGRVPEKIEALLRKMTFHDHFAAVRDLHALVTADGESAAALTALTRAYANLAMLTDRQWDAMPWVFKARALLYAERLRAKDPASPWGHWARAYAAALVGLHRLALDDFAAAEKVRGDTPTPAWATLADAVCRFDSARLEQVAAADPLADTAAVFRFLTTEDPFAAARALAAAKAALGRVPECYRVHDAVEDFRDFTDNPVSARPAAEEFLETFPARVRELPAIPAAVAEKATAAGFGPDLLQALAAAGRSRDDRREPTWAALGRYARETRLLHVKYEVIGAGSRQDFQPLFGDHQVWPLIEAATRPGDKAQLAKQLKAIKLTEFSPRHKPLLSLLSGSGQVLHSKYHSLAMEHGDRLYYDRYLQLRTMNGDLNYSPVAKQMYDVSPYAPLARALLIRDDWNFAKPHAAAWEAEARHPEVLSALARQSLNQRRPADAERQAAEAVRLAPQAESYVMLAEARLATGGEARYIATMDEFLATPDTGEGHAQARIEVVNYYLERKQFDKAQPYAEKAASEFRRSWAREGVSRCAEGRGDWETAEAVIRGMDEVCGDCRYILYYWRLRTGRGDLAAPRAAAERHLRSIVKPTEPEDVMLAGVMESAAGRPAKAAEFYSRLSINSMLYLSKLAAVAEFDAAGDIAQRETSLGRMGAFGPYQEVMTFVRQRLMKSPADLPTEKEIETEIAKIPPKHVRNFYYIVGRFLQTRGQKDLAATYFRRAGEHLPSSKNLAAILAALALREMAPKKAGFAGAVLQQQEGK